MKRPTTKLLWLASLFVLAACAAPHDETDETEGGGNDDSNPVAQAESALLACSMGMRLSKVGNNIVGTATVDCAEGTSGPMTLRLNRSRVCAQPWTPNMRVCTPIHDHAERVVPRAYVPSGMPMRFTVSAPCSPGRNHYTMSVQWRSGDWRTAMGYFTC